MGKDKLPTFDKHHIIPRSRNGADKGINIKKWNQKEHRALHRIFGNQTPDERVLQVLQWDSPVILRVAESEVRAVIQDLLREGEFYDPRAFKN